MLRVGMLPGPVSLPLGANLVFALFMGGAWADTSFFS